ncbi:type II 3-dehydroquinate dehydratase [Silvanigrella paludirubra]|uniref:3-dehydroquinate dehydratase n=1 Tax=Silvanigrella paludirubra TaxID=2499159 RepID=A0A6N6VZF6_9BACT|nr:type II 3-dehydroquinate dehydratase [Silvanigrella paludirubra]KAB8039878.1 type II 3-dehydroquinate dehydratase [Silvanigrella paludirubra]
MKIVLFVNGPNLGILGKRQTQIYGSETLEEITKKVKKIAEKDGISLQDYQSNIEGELINFLNEKYIKNVYNNGVKNKNNNSKIVGVIINPAGYSHTSIALRDALEVFKQEKIPIIEVHISNIFSREEFRHMSYVSPIATGVISGLGSYGYEVALNKIIEMEKNA